MKLFQKYSRINLISTIIIFLLGSLAFSFLLYYVIIAQIDEDLKIEKNEFLTYVNRFNTLPNIIEVHDQYIKYQPINKPPASINKIYTHTVYNKDEHVKELQRTIEFTSQVNNGWYLVHVSKSLEGADELIQTIIAITVVIILLILAVTFFINRIVLKKLWHPFYSTLKMMQQFRLDNPQPVNFNDTNIDEFNRLNSILKASLNKAQQDYQLLKEFTENASHELQTPLAVIQSKLDILIQNEKLSETESETIEAAYAAVQNLKKLNQSLLLLTKIENNQFNEKTAIDILQLLQKKISQFADLWKSNSISSEININPATLYGNALLIDILLNNLMSNATRHNIQNGNISIHLEPNKLTVANSGNNVAIDGKILFKRFSKTTSDSESYGLGLSIIQQICLASDFMCDYQFYQPNRHTFTVTWAT